MSGMRLGKRALKLLASNIHRFRGLHKLHFDTPKPRHCPVRPECHEQAIACPDSDREIIFYLRS